MKFFNIDLHISVIEDIKTIFNDLGHQVDSKSLSFHTWVFNRTTDKVDVISARNWYHISPEMCDAFYERYKDELSGYDGFIVTHTPCFALLYEKFNKPIITVASTRYEAPYSANWGKWSKFNNFLKDKIDQGMVIPISNNLFDKSYCEHFTNREWQHIPSLCEYTNLKYTGKKDDLILYSKCKDINLPNVIKKEKIQDSSWENIYSHKGIIHIPYNISTMSIFEQKTAGIPLLFPSLDYLPKIKGNLSELFYAGMSDNPHGTTCEIWRSKDKLQLADFYNWTEVLYFDSEKHLEKLLDIVDFDKLSQRSLEENKIIKKETYEKWNKVLSDIQKPIVINNKNLISHVEDCFKKAVAEQSKITDEILKLDGMTGKRTRHFYNNICSMDDARYLEVGTWKGASVCSAMHQNDDLSCVCIDNWSEFNGPKKEFLENFNKFKGNTNSRFIESNCWDVDPKTLGRFNIYMYDGNHSEDSHFKALNHFTSCLDDEFIYLIDDWNWEKVRRGTFNSIEKNNFKILFKKEIRTTEGIHDEEIHAQPHGAESDWHNGICVFVLQKSQKDLTLKLPSESLISKLEDVLNESDGNEGSLFSNPNEMGKQIQLNFLTDHIKKINPKTILETGTHLAFFDLLASEIVPNIKIYTFGISNFSKRAVEILKQEKNPNITFFEGDSTKTLSSFDTDDIIDLAWVDGGHFGDVPMADLKNCQRLKIPHIFVDDYRLVREVKLAVDKFVLETDYEIISLSNKIDDRGIVYLSNKKNINISDLTFGILTSGRTEPDTPGATISVRSSDSSQSLLKTWGENVPNIYFATDVHSTDLRFIKCSDRNDYKSTGEKQINLCLNLLRDKPNTEWYVLADDDTYIYKDHLIEILNNFKDHKEPIIIGKAINYCPWNRDLLFVSGGAGIVMNRSALEKVCEFFSIKENYNHHTKVQYYGDVAIGYACKHFNINIVNCDGFISRNPESVCGQLEESRIVKENFPKLKDYKTNKIISYHSIDSDRFLNQDWDKVKYIKDVCQK